MKTGIHQCKIAMQVLAQSDCPRCDKPVTTERPNCAQCGLWLPWGDETITRLRAQRHADFIAHELDEERAWLQARADSQSNAPMLKPLFRLQALWHNLTLQPGRLVTAGFAVAGTCAVLGFLSLQVLAPHHTPRARDAATGRCGDGSWTYALSRAGACSGHGGVDVFYK